MTRCSSRLGRESGDSNHDAYEATASGALIIDIRSATDRDRDGVIPGSLHIPRTVLEWRLAPDSPWRRPYAPDLDQETLLLCDHGYSSSLAAPPCTTSGSTTPEMSWEALNGGKKTHASSEGTQPRT